MKRNILRELLNAGKPTFSTNMFTTSPQIAEIIGHSGVFDYIQVSEQNSSWALADLDNFACRVELFPHMSSMIKVEKELRQFTTQRALGAGIQNLLFASCDSAEELKECIRYVRPATPQDGGLHDPAGRRNVGYYFSETGGEAWAKAMRDVVIGVMIESESAVEQLDDILSVKGLDMVFFGPSGYGVSIGKMGQQKSSETRKIRTYVLETAIKKGVRPCALMSSYEEAKEYIDMGVRDFCVGIELATLYHWYRLNGGKMRELIGVPPVGPHLKNDI
ncbi:HpcH/HpaI aldolase/citrate lyase family protein [Chloroflexota bacterium]